MPTQQELLIEANKRGLLSGPKKQAFDEAVNRGLIAIPQEITRPAQQQTPAPAVTQKPPIAQEPQPELSQPDMMRQMFGLGTYPEMVSFMDNEVKKIGGFALSGTTDGSIDPVGLGATAGSMLFPPLSGARAGQLASKVLPKLDGTWRDVVLPAASNIVRGIFSKGVEHTIRFAKPVAGAVTGGSVGGFSESLADQGIVNPDKILNPFNGGIRLPSQDELDKAFDVATKAGKEMGVLELAGSVIFAPIARILGPNAELLAEQGRNVLRYAADNNIPVPPTGVTGSMGIIESFVDSFFPIGRNATKDNIKAMSRVLEAPIEDHVNFVSTAFKLEKDAILKEGGTLAEQGAVDTIKSLLQQSASVVSSRSGIANSMEGSTSSLIINGDMLVQAINKAQKDGLLDGLPEKTLDALRNYAAYAKVVGKYVAEDGVAKGTLGTVTTLAAGAATVGMTYPLFTGNQPVDLGGPLPGSATPGEVATFAGEASLLSWLAASMYNPRGMMNKWLTTGFLDSKATRELMRMAVNQSTKAAGNAILPSDPSQVFMGP